MQQHRLDAWLQTLAERMRQDTPALVAGLDATGLHSGLHNAWQRARRFGIGQPGDVIDFFSAALQLSPRFDETPAGIALLTDIAMPAWQRLYHVRTSAAARILDEAAALTGEPA